MARFRKPAQASMPPCHDHRQLDNAILSIKASFKVLDTSCAKLERAKALSRTRLISHILGSHSNKEPQMKAWRQHPQPGKHSPRARQPVADPDLGGLASDSDDGRRSGSGSSDSGSDVSSADCDDDDCELLLAALAAADVAVASKGPQHGPAAQGSRGGAGAGSGVATAVAPSSAGSALGAPAVGQAGRRGGALPKEQSFSSVPPLSRRPTAAFALDATSETPATLASGLRVSQSSLRFDSASPTEDDGICEDAPRTSSAPRVQVHVAANRPFSAPRMQWSPTKTTNTRVHSRPASSSGTSAARESLGNAHGRPGSAAVCRSTFPKRPGSAAPAGTAGTIRGGLRPRSAFGSFQRRQDQPTPRERPPVQPLCEPQGRLIEAKARRR
mmetsp:Transcript_2042/g.6003  ORF Transcript_2042/g.6003 Transcript_2042/m.6003 type:complete len:386 (+) Transcript_2042:85-1242(+)